MKLIHLNASSGEKEERMEAFSQVLENAEPLDKSFSLFAYYPDYLLDYDVCYHDTPVKNVADLNHLAMLRKNRCFEKKIDHAPCWW